MLWEHHGRYMGVTWEVERSKKTYLNNQKCQPEQSGDNQNYLSKNNQPAGQKFFSQLIESLNYINPFG